MAAKKSSATKSDNVNKETTPDESITAQEVTQKKEDPAPEPAGLSELEQEAADLEAKYPLYTRISGDLHKRVRAVNPNGSGPIYMYYKISEDQLPSGVEVK